MKTYEIRDPVHGFIKIDDWEMEIIDTPVFQRLRRIRQLAWTDMVYPGAMHTRFEHSLGVMHLATKMYNHIVDKKKDYLKDKLGFTGFSLERDRKLVRLACLLHDIGHPPFSHAGEGLMKTNPATKKPYSHEDYSAAIVTFKLKKIIDDHPLNKHYQITSKEIAEFLLGRTNLGGRFLWRNLVTGQIDADRADYLLRDSYHLGTSYGSYDLKRLLVTLTISRHPETAAPLIAVEEGGMHAAEALLIARYLMFTQVYFHHTRRAYDYHVNRVMKSILLADINQDCYLPPTSCENIDHYLSWDDWRVFGLLSKKKGGLDGEKIRRRKHDRCVFYTSEVPTEAELDQSDMVLNELGSIVSFVDEPEKSWYSTGEKDIMIEQEKAGQKTLTPLSSLSGVVKGLYPVRQRRIYVAQCNKDKGKKRVNQILGRD